MNIFVTGATGFIGRAVCAKMLERGWKVKGSVRDASLLHSLPLGVEGVNLGPLENSSLSKEIFFGIDTVIHLAARVHVMGKDSLESLDAFRSVNVIGTERLARAAVSAGVKRFIFVSSVKVNGEGPLHAYTERDIPNPQDAYGISKYEAENVLREISDETGLDVVILRLPLVYGPGVKANFKHLMKIAGSGLPLPFKGIHNKRSFIYLGNLTDAIMICVEHPRASGQVFLVSDEQDISTPDLIRMLAAAMNKKARLFFLFPGLLKILLSMIGQKESLQKLTGSLIVDSSKIRNVLGWTPPFTLEEGIRETTRDNK